MVSAKIQDDMKTQDTDLNQNPDATDSKYKSSNQPATVIVENCIKSKETKLRDKAYAINFKFKSLEQAPKNEQFCE